LSHFVRNGENFLLGMHLREFSGVKCAIFLVRETGDQF